MLNKSKGNMYGFVTHTWNPIKGKCSHDCSYCYMKKWKQTPLRLDVRESVTDLGKDNFIFVGSSTDMFAEDVPEEWIEKVLEHCRKFKNKYLFQSKNPMRINYFLDSIPKNSILCTTLETNRIYNNSNAPTVEKRAQWANIISEQRKTMVTVEPIMDFDMEEFINLIRMCNPFQVNIGADSKEHNLPEPSSDNIRLLAHRISEFTEVKIKDNLRRLLK